VLSIFVKITTSQRQHDNQFWKILTQWFYKICCTCCIDKFIVMQEMNGVGFDCPFIRTWSCWDVSYWFVVVPLLLSSFSLSASWKLGWTGLERINFQNTDWWSLSESTKMSAHLVHLWHRLILEVLDLKSLHTRSVALNVFHNVNRWWAYTFNFLVDLCF